jgi:RNA polymerase sigma factor (sigma-70 family)
MAEIFQTHLDAIYNYCYRRTGSWSAAEDLASIVFLEVWRSRHRVLELDESLLPWLYGVATNVCRNHQRSQRRRTSALNRLQLADLDPERDTEDVIAELDADRRLGRALDRLRTFPQADQDVFVLVCWEELSYAEAAQALDIPIGTVRSRLARVRRLLRLTDDLENTDV